MEPWEGKMEGKSVVGQAPIVGAITRALRMFLGPTERWEVSARSFWFYSAL